MEAIKYYVKGAFVGIVETPEVREQQEELIADLTAKVEDLVAEGRSEEEALGTAIASMGDLSGLVREFVTEETPPVDVPVQPVVDQPVMAEVYASRLRLHVTLLSVGGAIAALFVMSVFAAVGGALRAEAALWDLFLGMAALAWMAWAIRSFHEHPNDIETIEVPGKLRQRKAVMQWVAVCGIAFVANAILQGVGFWAWTVWGAAAAWPAGVFLERRFVEAGKFAHPPAVATTPARTSAVVPSANCEPVSLT